MFQFGFICGMLFIEVIIVTVGGNIKKTRKAKKLTQQQLADKLDLSLMSVRRYESGERELKLDMIKRIADALDISVNDLLLDVVISKSGYNPFANNDDYWWKREQGTIKKLDEDLFKTLDSLTPKTRIGLLYSFTSAISSFNKLDTPEGKDEAIARLSDVISYMGQMADRSFGMRLASEERPDGYMAFLQRFERAVISLGDHKEALIQLILKWNDEQGNTKLRELIYGNDTE